MRLKIGESAKTGDLLCLSKNGNLRRVRSGADCPVGFALMKLRRGRIAIERRPGHWTELGTVDPELTKISLSYLYGRNQK